ncbi:MAG TPA: alanine racemase [Blastocatellia bacterium]|nr:alanine racemase [Blastocatellia bacterium]
MKTFYQTQAEITPQIATELLARFGSPLYVYDAAMVRRAFDEFRAAFSYEPADFHYAIVCNKNAYLVRLLYEMGAGIHANTPGDAHAALVAGVPPQRIVYSGTNLNAADFEYLLNRQLLMNIDSLDQLRDLASFGGRGETGLRLLIDDADRPNRIGVTVAELPEAVDIAQRAGLRLAGLHMYTGTNTLRAKRFIECLDRMIEASDILPDLEYLDVGGGFGVAYKEDRSRLDLHALGQEFSRRMHTLSERRGRAVRLIIEPGRVLVAHAGMLLMRVVSVKQRGGRRYVGVDSTVGNIVVESVYHPYHRIEAISPRTALLDIPTDVCGNTTHSRDYLGRSCRLPELIPGDILALRDVGAYGYAMSSHFLNRPRPAEVVIDGGIFHLTTRRETFDDLLATQVRI